MEDLDYYYMSFALLAAKRSNDPETKVGACIVNQDNKVVGIGYNEFPNGCEDKFPWTKGDDDMLKNKYTYVCHAELNAVLNKTSADLKGCKIYVTLCPCNECAKLIIQSGIGKVIYLSDKHKDKKSTIAAKKMFEVAGITCVHLQSTKDKIVIDFKHE